MRHHHQNSESAITFTICHAAKVNPTMKMGRSTSFLGIVAVHSLLLCIVFAPGVTTAQSTYSIDNALMETFTNKRKGRKSQKGKLKMGKKRRGIGRPVVPDPVTPSGGCDEDLDFTDLPEDARALAEEIYRFPGLLHERYFGSPSMYCTPAYEVVDWTESTGFFFGVSEDGDEFEIDIVQILADNAALFQQAQDDGFLVQDDLDFIAETGLRMTYVLARALDEEVLAMVITTATPEFAEPFDVLVVISPDPSYYGVSSAGFGDLYTTSVGEGRRLSGAEVKHGLNMTEASSLGVEGPSKRHLFAGVSSCGSRSIVQSAFNQADANCRNQAGSSLTLNRQCASDAINSFETTISGPRNQLYDSYRTVESGSYGARERLVRRVGDLVYQDHVEYVPRFRVVNRGTRDLERAPEAPLRLTSFQEMSRSRRQNRDRPEAPIRMTHFQEFIRGDREQGERAPEAPLRIETFQSLGRRQIETTREASIGRISPVSFCPETFQTQVQSSTAGCYRCSTCDTADPSVECCNDQDCPTPDSQTCIAGLCLNDGNPRFSLTWTGDDDLDLYVTAPGGNIISYRNTYDPVSGGRLDNDDIPRVVGTYVENIFFPTDGTAPLGEYQFFVKNFNIRGGSSDSFLVEVFVGKTPAASYQFDGLGQKEATDFITYTLEAQNAGGTGDCSAFPAGLTRDVAEQAGDCRVVPPNNELRWFDVVSNYQELPGGTSGVQLILNVDQDLISKTKSYEDDPYWWQYYRSFWDESGTRFVGNGQLSEEGDVRTDCRGVTWYSEGRAVKRIRFGNSDKFSTRTCHRVGRKGTNDVCEFHLGNHYRAPVGDFLPGLSPRGPTLFEPNVNLPGVALNFGIFLDEEIELAPETFSCYGASMWRHVMPGEVTPDGWGIVPASPDPQGTYPTPFIQWIFVAPKGRSVRVGSCNPLAIGCPTAARGVGDVQILDPPLSSPSEEELFQRLIDDLAALGFISLAVVSKTAVTSDDRAKEGFYISWPDGTDPSRRYVSERIAPDQHNIGELFRIIRGCNCLTINGSGNTFDQAIQGSNTMAEAAGRSINIHFYMPVSIGPESYQRDDRNTRLPEIVGSLADLAAEAGVRLDIRGHSWSSWLLWRACGEVSTTRCSHINLTTYSPATLIENWDRMRQYINAFQGRGNIVYGENDPLARFSLFAGNNEGYSNQQRINWIEVQSTGHSLADVIRNCRNNCP